MIKKFSKLFLYFIVFSVLALATNPYSFAQEDEDKLEECDEDQEFIKGTWCPCPKDIGYASLCGLVNNGNIIKEEIFGTPTYATRKPLKGITVSIYENDPSSSTGQPFGNLERKLVECYTSEEEGKYFCPMRRLNPGNMVYVIFSCGSRVADIKIVPSSQSIVGLNSDISCSGTYSYTPQKEVLEYADRDKFLGCATVDEDALVTGETSPSPNIGFKETEILYTNTGVEEKGGDIRFSPYGSILFLTNGHGGSYNELDCLVRYRDTPATREFSLSAADGIYAPQTAGGVNFDGTEVKCNFDPNGDGNGAMHTYDELTTPFRYDIPDSYDENTHRVWETRKVLQREYQDPRAWLQYNHLMFGECAGYTNLVPNGSNLEPTPLSCKELIKCGEFSDPFRNIHTTASFGSRLASPVSFMDIVVTEERDPNDIVCRDYEGDYGEPGKDVLVAQCKPPIGGENCYPGDEGCPYLMNTEECYMPQFYIHATGMKKPKTDATVNDAYGEKAARDAAWEFDATEDDLPHESGNYINYSVTNDPLKSNSPSSSVRISSTGQISDVGGVLSNRFVGQIDAQAETYEYDPHIVIWDVGGDVQSLCPINNINELFITPSTEGLVKTSNSFIGDGESHRKSDVGGTATYATQRALLRDSLLDVNPSDGAYDSIVSELAKGTPYETNVPPTEGLGWGFGRDAFDTMQRAWSGDGEQLRLLDFVASIYSLFDLSDSRSGTGAHRWKSFSHRVFGDTPPWNPTTPTYTRTSFCTTQEEFYGGTAFPPIGPKEDIERFGYPGPGIPGCIEWKDLISDYSGVNSTTFPSCESWPGIETEWPPSENVNMLTNPKTGSSYGDSWPGIDQQLRTCKLEGCRTMTLVNRCIETSREVTEYVCAYAPGASCPDGGSAIPTDSDGDGLWDPNWCCLETVTEDNLDCADWNGDGEIETRLERVNADCSNPDTAEVLDGYYECLMRQEDTWVIWKDPDNSGNPHWEYLENHQSSLGEYPYRPDEIDPNDPHDEYGDTFYACDLWNVTSMLKPGDIETTNSARIIQETMRDNESQMYSDPISQSANYTALSLTSPVEGRKEQNKAAFSDWATTNDTEDIQGGGFGAVHRNTAGIRGQGGGTGATASLLDIVAHPERSQLIAEDFPEITPEMWACVPEIPGEWCELITPPGNVDFDNLVVGDCAPNTRASNCPLNGKNISPEFEKLLGAAGYNAGVNGSLILAVMELEMNNFGAYDRWDFTNDQNIINWGAAWYARMPYCNELVTDAMPPFGLITEYFDKAVIQGGFSSDRGELEDVYLKDKDQVLLSKCNLVDAVFAVAQILSGSVSGTTCNNVTPEMVTKAIKEYASGFTVGIFDEEDVASMEYVIPIGVNCQ